MAVAQLHPWDQAPRVVDARLATVQLERFGQRVYPVVAHDGTVLWGWEWVEAAHALGWDLLWCTLVPEATPAETAWAIGAWRQADRSAWDHAQLLAHLEALPPDLRDAAGYSADAVRDLRRHLVPTPIDDLTMELAAPSLDLGWAPLPVVPARGAVHDLVPNPLPAGHAGFNTLLSFWYFKNQDVEELQAQLGGARIFVDSGAYTAKTQGADIDIEEYVAWLNKWAPRLEAFVNLDVIGDAEATCRNQLAMEAMGVDCLPVFHGGEDWRYLEAYCEQHPYVALGGMVGFQGSGVMRWVAQCFEIGAKYGTAFHGFGQTSADMLAEFPWYSVDSSSWGGGHRFGRIDLWDHRAAEFVRVEVGDADTVYRHAELVRDHGVDPDCLADREQYHARHAIAASSYAWRRYADFLRRRHGPVAVRDGSRAPGLHLYLVDGSTQNLRQAADHALAMEAR